MDQAQSINLTSFFSYKEFICCGKGVQTFDLAGIFSGEVTAIDNHPALKTA